MSVLAAGSWPRLQIHSFLPCFEVPKRGPGDASPLPAGATVGPAGCGTCPAGHAGRGSPSRGAVFLLQRGCRQSVGGLASFPGAQWEAAATRPLHPATPSWALAPRPAARLGPPLSKGESGEPGEPCRAPAVPVFRGALLASSR